MTAARPFDLPERYAIIPIEPGPAPAAAIAIGNIEQVLEYIPQSHAREKAEAELAHARVIADQTRQAQAATTKLQVAAFADSVLRLKHRLDQFEQRKAEQVRRDAEEAERKEAERIAAHLDALPDPDDPDTWDGPRPSGELTPIAASHPEDKRQLAALDQGELPNELLQGAPPDPGNYPLGLDDARRAAVSNARQCNILGPSPSAWSDAIDLNGRPASFRCAERRPCLAPLPRDHPGRHMSRSIS